MAFPTTIPRQGVEDRMAGTPATADWMFACRPERIIGDTSTYTCRELVPFISCLHICFSSSMFPVSDLRKREKTWMRLVKVGSLVWLW